ncbi:hypothetical protein J3R83DRAFT_6348 [Lanmaoa asiatica]|nr:hypothetical protein J3R83DRAFT_6348 [Lanmaoa asiatica]
MIAILALILALLLILILHPPPIHLPETPDHLPPLPPQSPPLSPRHVSFSLVSSDTSYSIPLSPVSLPIYRRWSSPFQRRKSSASDSPSAPQPYTAQNSPALVDQFGPLPPSSSPKSARRLSNHLRLPLSSKRRSFSDSSTPTLNTHAPSPPPSTSAAQSSPPLQRPRFVNPFSKHSRSRTLSPPSAFKSLDSSSAHPSDMSPPSPPPPGRRSLVNKFKSVFKSVSPEPSPIIRSKPIVKTINTRLRRKPVARTQPYGPPWNAPMPVPDLTHFQHPPQKAAETMFPSSQTSRKHSVHQGSLPEKSPLSPGQLSPRTFINELDEKLSLLQQQRIQDLIPSPHEIE